MPQSVDAARVLQFADKVDHLFQQRMTRTRAHVQLKTGVTGTQCAFDLVGPSEMQDITGVRDGDTAWIDVNSSRRWAPKADFIHPVLLSRGDRLATITDLSGAYVRNGVMAANRKIDKVMIDAANGTATTGETGGSTSTFDTSAPTAGGGGGNQIAVGGTGLTVDKMREARGHFLDREVGVDDMENGVEDAFVWLMSGRQMRDLLAETEATSWDYVGDQGSRMPLVNGIIPKYMGFRIRVTNQLPTTSDDRINFCWHRDAMGLAIWSGGASDAAEMEGAGVSDSFVVTVDRLPTKQNARGIIVMANFGAVRVQDAGVLAVVCDEP